MFWVITPGQAPRLGQPHTGQMGRVGPRLQPVQLPPQPPGSRRAPGSSRIPPEAQLPRVVPGPTTPRATGSPGSPSRSTPPPPRTPPPAPPRPAAPRPVRGRPPPPAPPSPCRQGTQGAATMPGCVGSWACHGRRSPGVGGGAGVGVGGPGGGRRPRGPAGGAGAGGAADHGRGPGRGPGGDGGRPGPRWPGSCPPCRCTSRWPRGSCPWPPGGGWTPWTRSRATRRPTPACPAGWRSGGSGPTTRGRASAGCRRPGCWPGRARSRPGCSPLGASGPATAPVPARAG
jgi:hypothetical protein